MNRKTRFKFLIIGGLLALAWVLGLSLWVVSAWWGGRVTAGRYTLGLEFGHVMLWDTTKWLPGSSILRPDHGGPFVLIKNSPRAEYLSAVFGEGLFPNKPVYFPWALKPVGNMIVFSIPIGWLIAGLLPLTALFVVIVRIVRAAAAEPDAKGPALLLATARRAS